MNEFISAIEASHEHRPLGSGMDFTVLPRSWAPHVQALLRIIVGLLFLQHGFAKLVDFPHMENLRQTFSVFGQMSDGFRLAAGMIETAGGVSLAVGFLTRPVAFVLCGFSAVAYFMVHAPQSFFPALNGGEHSVLFCFASLFLAAGGPGSWAIDSR
jgi:putative oxidoreductase